MCQCVMYVVWHKVYYLKIHFYYTIFLKISFSQIKHFKFVFYNRNLSIRCTCVCIKDNHGDQKQAAMMFSYYYLLKEMVYNAGETDTQTRTYDPPITSRCRFLNCWKLNNNSMAHEGR